MLFKALSAAVYGIDAYLVEVEVDVSAGLGNFLTVGLTRHGREGEQGAHQSSHQKLWLGLSLPEHHRESCSSRHQERGLRFRSADGDWHSRHERHSAKEGSQQLPVFSG